MCVLHVWSGHLSMIKCAAFITKLVAFSFVFVFVFFGVGNWKCINPGGIKKHSLRSYRTLCSTTQKTDNLFQRLLQSRSV